MNEWMNECLTPPQHENQIGYWVSEKGKCMKCIIIINIMIMIIMIIMIIIIININIIMIMMMIMMMIIIIIIYQWQIQNVWRGWQATPSLPGNVYPTLLINIY